MMLLVRPQEKVRSKVEKGSHFREHLNHEQTAGRNITDIKGAASESLEGNEKHIRHFFYYSFS